MTTDDAGEVSSGQAQKAILCHTEEASQQRRANGVYQVGEYWGDYSGCIWGISWAEDMLIRSSGKHQLWPEHKQWWWKKDADTLERCECYNRN